MYIHTSIHNKHIYIYIYKWLVQIEESKINLKPRIAPCPFVSSPLVLIYIYIHNIVLYNISFYLSLSLSVCMYVCMCIYIYIYRERERYNICVLRIRAQAQVAALGNPETADRRQKAPGRATRTSKHTQNSPEGHRLCYGTLSDVMCCHTMVCYNICVYNSLYSGIVLYIV